MTKTCSHCKLEKAETEFYRDRTRCDGLANDCKVCGIAKVRCYQATDGGRDVATRSNRKRIGTAKRRASANPASRRYKKTDNGKLHCQQADRRRRELLQGLDLSLTLDDITQIHERFEHRCFNCTSTTRLEIDHHKPLSRGFGLSMSNAVLLCKKCNTSKNNKPPEVFYTSQQLEALRGYGIL